MVEEDKEIDSVEAQIVHVSNPIQIAPLELKLVDLKKLKREKKAKIHQYIVKINEKQKII